MVKGGRSRLLDIPAISMGMRRESGDVNTVAVQNGARNQNSPRTGEFTNGSMDEASGAGFCKIVYLRKIKPLAEAEGPYSD